MSEAPKYLTEDDLARFTEAAERIRSGRFTPYEVRVWIDFPNRATGGIFEQIVTGLLAEIDRLSNLAPCTWEHDKYAECWDTDCGENFVIESGTPTENRMEFCCFCGCPLQETEPKEQEGDE